MNTMAAEARRKALCARLARVEGQVRGLQRLIEADTDPEKVALAMHDAWFGRARTRVLAVVGQGAHAAD